MALSRTPRGEPTLIEARKIYDRAHRNQVRMDPTMEIPRVIHGEAPPTPEKSDTGHLRNEYLVMVSLDQGETYIGHEGNVRINA